MAYFSMEKNTALTWYNKWRNLKQSHRKKGAFLVIAVVRGS
jgi:hypothetical protein